MSKVSTSEFVTTIPIEVSISIEDLYSHGYRFLAVEDKSNIIMLFKSRPLRNIVTRQWIPVSGDTPIKLSSYINNNSSIFFSGLYLPEVSELPWSRSLHIIDKVDKDNIYIVIPATEIPPDKGMRVFGRKFATKEHKRYISAGILENGLLLVYANGKDEWTATDEDGDIQYDRLCEWWCVD